MKLQIRYGKLSGYKVAKILKHFIVDVEASKTAELMGLNRKTIDGYYGLFRSLIYEQQKQEFSKLTGTIELDESYFGARRIRGKHIKLKRGRGTRKQPVFADEILETLGAGLSEHGSGLRRGDKGARQLGDTGRFNILNGPI